jgi:signal peptidase I
MPLGGLKWRKEIEEGGPLKEKESAEKPPAEDREPKTGDSQAPHVQVYHYVKRKHHHIKKLKKKYFPGVWGEIVSFLFAFLVAWAIIQMLGWVLGTGNPLVVVESESMLHKPGWEAWYPPHNLSTDSMGGGINVGDIVVVKGEGPKSINVGDVIIYTKYSGLAIGGEPVIHRVIGIVDVSGDGVTTQGAVSYENGSIKTPCSSSSSYGLDEIRNLYSTDAIKKAFPGIEKDLGSFRLFITKGDNNIVEDQCRGPGMISYPVHQRLLQGRATMDIPYVGYVKLGIVCLARYVTGNACGCRCWWPADHPACCKTGGAAV